MSHLITVQKNKQMAPAVAPRMTAPIGPAKPAAGVTATKPATRPEHRPSSDTFHLKMNSRIIHASAAAAVARKVLVMASAAEPPASSAEPALKPNQPTHRSAAPMQV